MKFFNKKEKVQAREHGRSMIEVLGVLAIVGVLSLLAIVGYSYAMNKHRSNVILNDVRAVVMGATVQNFMGNTAEGDSVTSTEWSVGTQWPFEYVVRNESVDFFSVTGQGINQKVCAALLTSQPQYATEVVANLGLSEFCHEGSGNTVSFFVSAEWVPETEDPSKCSVTNPCAGVCSSCEDGACEDKNDKCPNNQFCVQGACKSCSSDTPVFDGTSCKSCVGINPALPIWNAGAQKCESCPSDSPVFDGTSCRSCLAINPDLPVWNAGTKKCESCPSDAPIFDGLSCRSCAVINPDLPVWNTGAQKCESCPSDAPIFDGLSCRSCAAINPAFPVWNAAAQKCECSPDAHESGGVCVCDKPGFEMNESYACVCKLTPAICLATEVNTANCTCCPTNAPVFQGGACKTCAAVNPKFPIWDGASRTCKADPCLPENGYVKPYLPVPVPGENKCYDLLGSKDKCGNPTLRTGTSTQIVHSDLNANKCCMEAFGTSCSLAPTAPRTCKATCDGTCDIAGVCVGKCGPKNIADKYGNLYACDYAGGIEVNNKERLVEIANQCMKYPIGCRRGSFPIGLTSLSCERNKPFKFQGTFGPGACIEMIGRAQFHCGACGGTNMQQSGCSVQNPSSSGGGMVSCNLP